MCLTATILDPALAKRDQSPTNQAALIGMKFADEAIKNHANASVELDLELVGIGRLSGRKG